MRPSYHFPRSLYCLGSSLVALCMAIRVFLLNNSLICDQVSFARTRLRLK